MAQTRPVPGHGDPDRPLPQPDPPRGKGDGDGDGPHYSTWLVVRYQAGDTGSRPLASGSVFWESPDVWTVGSQGVNMPVAGEATQVFARVSNLGMQDATGVTIKYWWADPSVAIVEDPTKLIGQITNGAIPSNGAVVFQCPQAWVPVTVNNGHECLVVEAYIPVLDGLSSPMNPVGDRHVGQKNEQLVLLQQGQSFHFDLHAANIAFTTQEVTVEARMGAIPRDFALRFGRPEMWADGVLDPALPLPLELKIDPKPIGRLPDTGDKSWRPSRSDTGRLGPVLATATQRCRPREVRRVTVAGAMPRSAHAGEVYAVRVSQRIGQTVVGGYTLYAAVGEAPQRK